LNSLDFLFIYLSEGVVEASRLELRAVADKNVPIKLFPVVIKL
jgi:hypothetical protein